MKKVYICSPCRGDYQNNIQRAREYSRAAAMQGCIPITPHIYLTQFMDDTVPEERETALSFGLELVLMCDELWAFGLECPTEGMAGEIRLAKEAGIPVVNGFKAITELEPSIGEALRAAGSAFAAAVSPIGPAISAASAIAHAAAEMEAQQRAKVGNVTIKLPRRRAIAAGVPDFEGLTLELDGNIVLDLAEKLKANPGQSFDVAGGGRP